ncbi:MAG: hypothetical protein AAFQ95_07655 [Cyanobacteria bacterium J06621_3]
MYSDKQISQLFGDEPLAYEKNKHRGGASNEKGNTYENFYATYKIALLSADAIENQADIKFYSQVLSFVDDIIILYEQENKLQHHQLKNSPNIRWGSGLRSLSDDFDKQAILNRSVGKESEMVLDPEVAGILSNIANFSYSLSKGFLHWQYGINIDQGTIPNRIGHPSFNRFQERIKASKPETFEEFEVLL